jgi:hypothetical protein
MNQAIIEALLAERAGYVNRKLADRVKQVDDQLAHYGYTAKRASAPVETATAEPVVEVAAKPATRKRASN